METRVSGNLKRKNSSPTVEVHARICSELTKLLDKIASILPALESARPGSTQGLKTLCSINCSIGKGKLVIQHCAESSKLYLVLTGGRVLARCERLRSSVIENLSLIQSMVPMALADQVTEVISYLNNIKFAIDPREAAAAKAISQLLEQVDSTDEMKLKTLQIAASSLNLTSQKTLLIEKRAIKKLLDEVAGKNPEKEHIVRFLYNLVVKHARSVKPVDTKIELNQRDEKDESQIDTCETLEPEDVNNNHLISSLEVRCMSHLEEQEENKGNSFPKAFKDRNEALLQVLFPWNRDYVEAGSFSEFNSEKFLKFFKDLAALETEKRNKAVEDVVVLLERDVDTCYLMLSNGFEDALIEFLGMSFQLSDTVAQKVGARLFLAFIRNNRVEFPTFTEEILRIVTPFLDVETSDALAVIQKFSHCFNSASYSPSKKLSSDDINNVEICMEIVCELSSEDNTKSEIFSSGYLRVLASILSYEKLAVCSLKVLEIYSSSKEGAELIGENPKFISCLVELLETSTHDKKEVAVSILYSICSLRPENCFVVRDQFVVPALVHLSVNGSEIATEMSRKLLELLRDLREGDSELGRDTGIVGTCTDKQFVSKTCPILPKKKGIFARFLSLAHI